MILDGIDDRCDCGLGRKQDRAGTFIAMEDGHIGVDESGKGDFFGPLVIAACFVGPEHLAELEGVKDSKKLTDPVAMKLAVRIKAVCPHAIVAIGPAKYNELYAKFNNLNSLLAWGHARAIENVLEQRPATKVISDEFAKGGFAVKRALFEKGKTLEFVSAVRAEQDIAVAAASILARAEFLWRLKKLGEEYGVQLPKGASNVIEPGVRFVREQGASQLPMVAKMHFKTSAQVLERSGATR
jgi:ribonuclease HIII